jgi:hypothetical protein
MNDGDWVESCSALVEHHSGQWEIVTWIKEKDDVAIDTDSSSREQSPGRSGKNRTDVQRSSKLRDDLNINEVATKV